MTILINSLRSLLLVLCALVLLPRQGVAQGADTDAYGGSTRVRWEATGWFRLQQNGGRFWLVTPEGHPFFNLGINHLASGMDNAQRADVALATELTRKFKSWHFNTAGYNASPLFAKDTPFVSFLNLVPTSRFLRDKASFPDVFDAAFQRDLQTRIEHQCRDVRDNPRLLGYVWTDTPLWNLKDARRTIKKDWVSTLRQLAAAAPGKIAYVDFLLETHGGDFAKIAQIYDVKATSRAELLAAPFDAVRVDAPPVAAEDAQFLRRIARTFYGVAGPAYRKNDPHHLVWGEMYLQGVHPDEVLEEAMPHIDVLLIQPTGNPAAKEPKDHFPAALFDRLHQTYRKPIIIGDHQFSFATPEFPRTMWFQYPSAAEAVAAYGVYLREATARPYIVGYNRCQIRDVVQPDGMLKQGLLQRNGEPYPDFASQIAAFNRQTLDALYKGLKP
ncbi:hypothetical protein LBMAG56_16500 [Verrucomicrobiota bacterium]|nr:hypothetical protein LBMAG56_16500 [Verrucomicrobiota bacterium]